MPNNTFDVTYASGEVITVKAVPWSKLDDVSILQSKILQAFLENSGAVGSLLKPSNVEVWSYIKKLASLLPVVGGVNLDIEQIQDLYDIVKIFITTTDTFNEFNWVMPENGEMLQPSKISQVHSLNFYSILNEIREVVFNKTVQQQEKTETPN